MEAIDSMPCDADLLDILGRVTWAGIRLHHQIRDAINKLNGVISDQPFVPTLGGAITNLRSLAAGSSESWAPLVVQWCDQEGKPIVADRNLVAHANVYTDPDGSQALRAGQMRLTDAELRKVGNGLVSAAKSLQALLP